MQLPLSRKSGAAMGLERTYTQPHRAKLYLILIKLATLNIEH